MCCRSWGDCWMSKLLDIFYDVTRLGTKIPTSEYQKYGEYPIFDQGQEYISGYTCEKEGIYENVPAIIFGDHTRVLKYVDMPCFLGADGVKLLKAKRNDVNTKYLFYRLCAADIPNTGYNRHFKWLKEVEFMLPSFEEQKEISSNLDKVTHTIDLCNTILEKLDLLVKSQFVKMFGDIATSKYKYPTKKLGDVAKVGSSHRVFTTEFVENGVPFYRGTEIGELANGHKPSECYYISYEHYKRLAGDETKPHIGDLLMPSICNKGQVWMVDTDEPFYYKDGRVLCISPDRKIYNTKFLQAFMREKTTLEYPKLGSGSTFAEFKIFLLKDIDVLTPPLNLQNQFADFVKTIDKSKLAVKKTLEKAETLKKALMQEYFG